MFLLLGQGHASRILVRCIACQKAMQYILPILVKKVFDQGTRTMEDLGKDKIFQEYVVALKRAVFFLLIFLFLCGLEGGHHYSKYHLVLPVNCPCW